MWWCTASCIAECSRWTRYCAPYLLHILSFNEWDDLLASLDEVFQTRGQGTVLLHLACAENSSAMAAFVCETSCPLLRDASSSHVPRITFTPMPIAWFWGNTGLAYCEPVYANSSISVDRDTTIRRPSTTLHDPPLRASRPTTMQPSVEVE
jgi:hypothetical protein